MFPQRQKEFQRPSDPQTVSLIPGEAKEIGWDGDRIDRGRDIEMGGRNAKKRGTQRQTESDHTKVKPVGPCKHLPGHFDSAGEGISISLWSGQGCCPGGEAIRFNFRPPKIADGFEWRDRII